MRIYQYYLNILFLGLLFVNNLYAINQLSNQCDDLCQLESNQLQNIVTNTSSTCGIANDYWFESTYQHNIKLQNNESVINDNSLVMQANSITGVNSYTHHAIGNVTAYKSDKTINATELTYNQVNSLATGNDIILNQQYTTIYGKYFNYFLDTNMGTIEQASMLDDKSNFYTQGSSIDILSKNDYKIFDSFFTSCDPKDPDWHMTAQNMQFDYQNNEGTARKTTFYVESLPIMYMPYFRFPLGKRKSGFLIPEFGSNSTSGLFAGTPYYFNLADNYDMTFEPKLYTNAGLSFSDEFRYLNTNSKGEIYTEQVPYDNQTNNYRYYWHLWDKHSLTENVNIGYTFNQVSDNNYFVDFGNFNSTIDNINLDRTMYFNYKPNWGLFNAKIQGYQTLNPSGQTTDTPAIYSMAPQLDFQINPIAINDSSLTFALNSQYTNFISSSIYSGNTVAAQLQDGQRYLLYPSLSLPLSTSWGYVTPKFGINDTYYVLNPFNNFYPNGALVNRNIAITSIDSGMFFDQALTLNSSGYLHTLEPRVYYLYIPQINQGNIPVFDTAQATPNINQLFSENRFSGNDRINSANDITVGLSSKTLNDNTGIEVANLAVAYRYYLTPNNNLLYGSYTQFGQLYQPNPNLIAELTNSWSDTLSTNSNFQYDNIYQNIDAWNVGLKYNPDIHKILNANLRYQYQLPVFYYAWTPTQGYTPTYTENQYALDISGQWPLFSEKWLLNARTNYDFTQKQILNVLGGIEYNAGCWSVNLVAENYLTNINEYRQAYFIQFSLTGLTNFGSGDPTTDLKINIPGYVPITTIR